MAKLNRAKIPERSGILDKYLHLSAIYKAPKQYWQQLAELLIEMDESTDSAHIRQVMGRYDLGLWEMSRLMNLEACAMASLVLGESFLDCDQRLQLQRVELEMLFNRHI